MLYVKFCFYQFLLFSLLFVVNIVMEPYANEHFTRKDFIAMIITIPILLMIFSNIDKLFRKFHNIRWLQKILISIPVFILSALFIGYIVHSIPFINRLFK